MKNFAILGALVLSFGSVATPAFADPTPAPTSVASATSTVRAVDSDQRGGGDAGVTERRYCIVGTVTGSTIARKTCQTRDAWLKQGFDPLAPQK